MKIFGAVCVEGPKWCGKTWTSSYHSSSAIFIGDPAGNFQNRQLAQLSPALVLEGAVPRLIDEWQEVPPIWDAVRSSVRVKQAVKRHFSDPSLACSLLKATPAGLLGDLETLGFLFEALCERDLKIDAVIELPDGQWCAFEIKLGANQIDSAAENLLTIRNEIADDPKGKPPAVLCVLCGMTNAAYRRPDGVFVVPITALKN